MNAVTQEITQLRSREGIAATLQSVHIEGRLDGLLLSMKARQHYENKGTDNLEAVYTFPLPWGATLLGLNAEIDGHRLQGTVLEKKEAAQRYEKAIDEGDTPIMVERSARGLYTANLGNLKPGEVAVIEIEYAQLLRFEQGQIRITLPTTVAPRYGDACKTGGLAAHASVDASLWVEYPLSVKVTLVGDIALAAVQCPSHAVTLQRQESTLEVSLTQGGFLDRDFVVLLEGLRGQSFAAVAADGDQFCVLASFCPDLPAQTREPLLLKILVDCSGSMGGDSMTAARKALHEVLTELDDLDWISYSRFGSQVAHDTPGLVPCSGANIQKVARCIAGTNADLGGTEMHAALLSTFNQSTGRDWKSLLGSKVVPDLSRDVLLITDGDIWDVERVIASAQACDHRVFAIGVGSAPAESLLREVAERTGGACELVSVNQSVAEVIMRMFRRMRSPRCANVAVDWGQEVVWQSAMPAALYGGDTLHLCARMARAPEAPPTLGWVAKNTSMQSHALQLHITTPQCLPRLVAAAQITDLTHAISHLHRVRSMVDPDMLQAKIAQSLKLALQYQLVTDQTNLILVHVREEHNKAEGLPALDKIAHMQAAGWGGLGSVVGASVAGTPPESRAMSGPAVWRTSNRTAAAAEVDDMPFDGIDDFEIPAFLRKQADDSRPGAWDIQYSKRLDCATLPTEVGPVATPLEILRAFDAAAQKAFAVSRFVQILQALRLSNALVSVRDHFSLVLGSEAKAWAVLVKWLADSMADQFTLSRQGKRLLSHCLKGENLPILDELHQRLTALVGSEAL